MKVIFFILFFFSCISVFSQNSKHKSKKSSKKLIVLSIDGFPGYYAEEGSEILSYMPNLAELIKKSTFSKKVRTAYPSVTYPAHTSMITGVEPSIHGIYGNKPLDPFNTIQPNAWMWFSEDIKVKTLWDFAKENGLTTASIYWPVTVGAQIDYNIPQYWRFNNNYDQKILKVISTPNLYEELKKDTGKVLGEHTDDEAKMLYAISLWKKKNPDLMFIYTTDIDTAHHSYGVYSSQAIEKIKKIDLLLGKLIKEVGLYKNSELGLIVISDHGFKEYNSFCYPNQLLENLKLYKERYKDWSYYFQTYGGMAVLYKNPTRKNTRINLRKLASDISNKCPGSVLDYNGKKLNSIKKNLSSNAIGVLYSNEKTVFLKNLNKKVFLPLNSSGYNHGFLPQEEDMHTIGLFYPANPEVEFLKVTRVFQYACQWLEIECKKGEPVE